MTHSTIEIPISSSVVLSIRSTDPEPSFEEPRYAVNWFNLKTNMGYRVYTWLASPLVAKVGGRLIFKGKRVKTLYGNALLEREMLLIVRYPSIMAFLKMIKKPLFQLYSLLRIKSVKDFVFGFTRKSPQVLTPDTFMSPDDCYLVYIFQHDSDHQDLLESLTTSFNSDIVYFGTKSAVLGRRLPSGKLSEVPFFVDGILVLRSRNEQELTEQVMSKIQVDDSGNNISAYAGIFRCVK